MFTGATKKVLSVILSVLLTFGAAAAFPGAASAAGGKPGIAQAAPAPGHGRVITPDAGGTPVNAPDKTDFGGKDLKDYQKLDPAKVQDPDGKKNFLEGYAKALGKPVGAVGFGEGFDATSSQPVNVIVQFNVMAAVAIKEYKQIREKVNISLDEAREISAGAHDAFADEIRALGLSAEDISYSYTDLVNGVAMAVPADKVAALAALPSVYSVTPDRIQSLPPDVSGQFSDFQGNGMYESRTALRSSQINDNGITGKGVTVAVLDTGIDYNHPDLKGAYAGGRNYYTTGAGSHPADDPSETTYQDYIDAGSPPPDSSGHQYYTSHGTHVSGTIAARGANTLPGGGIAPNSTLGIAPEAKIRMYKVLGPYGSGPSSIILQGITDAVADECDVLNLSLGADVNTPYDPENVALNNACVKGVIVCIASGNAGPGRATVGTPGTAALPITVAAGNYGGSKIFTYASTFSNSADAATLNATLSVEGYDESFTFDTDMVTGSDLVKDADGKIEFVCASATTDPTSQAEVDAIADGSLAGKLLVINRGSLTYDLMWAAVQRTGAAAYLVLNKDAEAGFITGTTHSGVNSHKELLFTATRETKKTLIPYYAAAKAGSGKAYIKLGTFAKAMQPNIMASFSSTGPVNTTFAIKPDITAPGVAVLSTQPAWAVNGDHNATDYANAYAQMQGTSMACPHLAGVAALMRQAFPTDSEEVIKARLMNTALPITDQAASVFQCGAGYVNPYDAIYNTKSYVTVNDSVPMSSSSDILDDRSLASLSFGNISKVDSGKAESRALTLTIHNTDTTAHNYSIASSFNDNVPAFSQSSAANNVYITVSDPSLAVPAGESRTFSAQVTVQATSAQGTYEGSLTVAYMDGATPRVYSLPFACNYGVSATPLDITTMFIHHPIITTETAAGVRDSAYGNASSVSFGYSGDLSNIDVMAYDMSNELVGYYGSFTTLTPGNWTLINLVGSKLRKSTGGKLETTETDLADGLYQLVFWITDGFGAEVPYWVGDYVVESAAHKPVIVLDNPTLLYPYTTGAPDKVNVTGKIYSWAHAQCEADGITAGLYTGSPVYDQTFCAVLAGSSYFYCDETEATVDGAPFGQTGNIKVATFTLTLTPSEASKTALQNFSLTAVDAYSHNYVNGTAKYQQYGSLRSLPATQSYGMRLGMSDVAATNGTATVTFGGIETAPLTTADFSLEYKINGGAAVKAPVTAVKRLDPASPVKYSVSFAPLSAGYGAQSVTLYVTYRKSTAQAPFMVSALTAVSGIEITNAATFDLANNPLTLTANVTPSYAANPGVVWSISNVDGTPSTIATLSGNVLTATARGTVRVRATAADGLGAAAYKDITIVSPVKSITVSSGASSMPVNGTLAFTAAVLPGTAVQDVTWSVTGTHGEPIRGVTITTGGVLTATVAGTYRVVATATDGSGVKGYKDITAKTSSVSKITISGAARVFTGSKTAYKATVLPADASNKAVTWSVTDTRGRKTKLAAIDQNGMLAAYSSGTVTIRATAKDGSKVYGTYTVKIVVPVSKITVFGKSKVYVNKKATYTALVLPLRAYNRGVTWSVTDAQGKTTALATIDASKGVLKAAGAGTVKVWAKAKDGSGVVGTYTVTIKK